MIQLFYSSDCLRKNISNRSYYLEFAKKNIGLITIAPEHIVSFDPVLRQFSGQTRIILSNDIRIYLPGISYEDFSKIWEKELPHTTGDSIHVWKNKEMIDEFLESHGCDVELYW